jgi:hypothetical protein
VGALAAPLDGTRGVGAVSMATEVFGGKAAAALALWLVVGPLARPVEATETAVAVAR